jgi:RHS repeat-associated protein
MRFTLKGCSRLSPNSASKLLKLPIKDPLNRLLLKPEGKIDYRILEYLIQAKQINRYRFYTNRRRQSRALWHEGFDYTYYLGDNLGNTRVTFDTKNGIAALQQQDDYYPFGLEINRTISSPKNEYLYNKKELQEEFSEYDYGARYYDPIIGRWNTVDPLAETSRRWSPYNYVENDPIRLTDPDGMKSSKEEQEYRAAMDWGASKGQEAIATITNGRFGNASSTESPSNQTTSTANVAGIVNAALGFAGVSSQQSGCTNCPTFGKALAKNMQPSTTRGKDMFSFGISKDFGYKNFSLGSAGISLQGNSKKGFGLTGNIGIGNDRLFKVNAISTYWNGSSMDDLRRNTDVNYETPWGTPATQDSEEWHFLGQMINPTEIGRMFHDLKNLTISFFKTAIYNGDTKQGSTQQQYGN